MAGKWKIVSMVSLCMFRFARAMSMNTLVLTSIKVCFRCVCFWTGDLTYA